MDYPTVNFNQANMRRIFFFLLGLVLYGASFAMHSVINIDDGMREMRGYDTAGLALIAVPLTLEAKVGQGNLQVHNIIVLATLAVFLINPLFAAIVLTLLFKGPGRVFLGLCVALLAALPFCWILLRDQRFIPIAGFYVWIAAMLLTMVSAPKFNPSIQAEPPSASVT
jgi:hypothetical protein